MRVRASGVCLEYGDGSLPWRSRVENGHRALDDIGFEIGERESVAILGGNGSGKTSLLLTIAGVSAPTVGTLELNGRCGALIDTAPGFHRDLTGRENLLAGAVLNGLTRREARRALEEMIDFTGLPAAALDAPLRTYSAGMAFRLAAALVATPPPEILVLDEVVSVADEVFANTFLDAVDQMVGRGSSVLFATHDLGVAEARCDRALVLERGRLIADGPIAEGIDAYRRSITSLEGHVTSLVSRRPRRRL